MSIKKRYMNTIMTNNEIVRDLYLKYEIEDLGIPFTLSKLANEIISIKHKTVYLTLIYNNDNLMGYYNYYTYAILPTTSDIRTLLATDDYKHKAYKIFSIEKIRKIFKLSNIKITPITLYN